MPTCRLGHRQTTGNHASARAVCLMLCCALMLPGTHAFTVRSARAEHLPAHTPDWTDFHTRDPGIVLASGSAAQGIVLLVANLSNETPARPCHFNGAVRTEQLHPPFGSGLQHPVFSPLSLAPGESLAIELPPPDIGVAPSQIKVLVMAIEADDAVDHRCPLMVQAMEYDTHSSATAVLIDRFTVGVERTFAVPGHARASVPLGFVGGNLGQAARLTLVSDHSSPLPAGGCALDGEVVAQIVPQPAEDPAGQTRSANNAWPISWQGPALKSFAIVEIPFGELDPGADRRVDALLKLRFDPPLPAACLKRLNASLQIFDQATGATRAVVPADRVFFNYHYFNNVN